MKQRCLICDREFKNILKHMSIFHEVGSMEELDKIANVYKEKEKKREEWIKLTRDLEFKLKNKEITIEQFREIRDKWIDKNG